MAALIDGKPVPASEQMEVRAGGRLRIGPLKGGLRGWLAVAGGFADPPPRFRSVPHRLNAGDVLMSGGAGNKAASPLLLTPTEPKTIRGIAGPHEVPSEILSALESIDWVVTPSIDRTGLRLRANQLPPSATGFVAATGELPSIGAQFGSVQWHPTGELVALGPDHPVTGGYLQPFTIVDEDRWKLAQLRPGDPVRWIIDKVRAVGEVEIHLA